MAQWVRAHAVKSAKSSSSPGAHMVEGNSWFPRGFPLTPLHVCCGLNMCAYMYIHTQRDCNNLNNK